MIYSIIISIYTIIIPLLFGIINVIISIVKWKKTKKVGIELYLSILIAIIQIYLISSTLIGGNNGMLPQRNYQFKLTELEIIKNIIMIINPIIQIIIFIKLIIENKKIKNN